MLDGRRFAVAFERAGVEVGSVSRRRTTAGGTTLAVLQGQRLDQQVMTMLQFSDNDMAENLARHVAIAEGLRPDWAGATAARAQVLQRLGIPTTGLRLLDGSGLSRANRASAQSLVAMLALAAAPTRPEFASVAVGGLPTAGRTGSLRPARGRFVTAPSKCAAGNLWAKTGLLRDVVGLAGYTRSTDGHLQAFAIVVNGAESSLTLRRRVDSLAATITGCW